MAEENMKKEKTLEDFFRDLDEVIRILENRETTLEDSFRAYEQGVNYLKECNEKIDQVEKKMLIINENGGLDEF